MYLNQYKSVYLLCATHLISSTCEYIDRYCRSKYFWQVVKPIIWPTIALSQRFHTSPDLSKYAGHKSTTTKLSLLSDTSDSNLLRLMLEFIVSGNSRYLPPHRLNELRQSQNTVWGQLMQLHLKGLQHLPQKPNRWHPKAIDKEILKNNNLIRLWLWHVSPLGTLDWLARNHPNSS